MKKYFLLLVAIIYDFEFLLYVIFAVARNIYFYDIVFWIITLYIELNITMCLRPSDSVTA